MGRPKKWKKRDDNKYYCQNNYPDGCEKSYTECNNMKQHYDRVHKQKRFLCSGYSPCKKDYSQAMLNDHVYFVHTHPEAGECHVCNISFTTRVALVAHFETQRHEERSKEQQRKKERDEMYGESVTTTTMTKISLCPLYQNKIKNRPGNVGTFQCAKMRNHNECRGVYERYFGRKLGNVKTGGYEFETVGHHDCNSSWYIYSVGDKKNPKTRYIGKSELTPGGTTVNGVSTPGRLASYQYPISTLTEWREKEEQKYEGGRRMTDSEFDTWWSSLTRLRAQKKLPVQVEMRKVIKYFVHPSRSILDFEFNIIVEYNGKSIERDGLLKVEEWYINNADCYNEEDGGLNDPRDNIFVEYDVDVEVLATIKTTVEHNRKHKSTSISIQDAAKKKKQEVNQGNFMRRFFNAS